MLSKLEGALRRKEFNYLAHDLLNFSFNYLETISGKKKVK